MALNVIPFSSAARRAARTTAAAMETLRLPVAPQAVCRLRFTPESKPGVPPLTPAEALMEVNRHQGLAKVELAGPGDPLASMATTLAAITLLKQHHPALTIGLTTLGIGGEQHIAGLVAAGLGSITVLVDTLDPAIAEKLYAWIRPGKKTVPLHQAVPLLLEEQRKTVHAMAGAGIAVSIRTTVYPGINADQIEAIAETMAGQGATAMVLVPFFRGSHLSEGPVAPTRTQMEQIRSLVGRHLPSVTLAPADCACATDETRTSMQAGLPQPSGERPRVAVASATGMEVDLHLGQARSLLIYGPRDDGLICLLESRQTPDPGSGENRWEQLATSLHDCFALLTANAGQRPREVLASRGIRTLITEENIEGTVDVLYGGGKKQKCKK